MFNGHFQAESTFEMFYHRVNCEVHTSQDMRKSFIRQIMCMSVVVGAKEANPTAKLHQINLRK